MLDEIVECERRRKECGWDPFRVPESEEMNKVW